MATRDNEHSPQFRTEKVGQAQANLVGCVLYVSSGADEDKGRRLILESGTAIVGSGERADFVLHDASGL